MRKLWMALLGMGLVTSPALALPPVSTTLTGLTVSATTGEKPQSKVWTHDGRWWCVMPNSSGTFVWRLDGTTWTNILQLSTSTSTHADVKTVGNVAHVLLYTGGTSQLASIEYQSGPQTYQAWTTRPANAALPLESSTETASLDIDSQGRMWIATDFAAGSSQVVVYYADAPYSSWSGPVTIATGIAADDIAVVTAMPGGKVGVLWSNQNTQRFGFKLHVDGDAPGTWSADELPASQSAQNVGLGMADDHLNLAVASDGTLYAAVKTSYDTAGYPKIALLVRRPAGTWDNLYEVDQSGTRGIVLLDETAATVTVLYTSTESAGNILYKESATGTISLGASAVLMPGGLNDVTSTKQNISGEVVILAGNGSSLSGRLMTTPAAGYTITASAGANGTITPNGAVAVSSGGSQAFAITANAGYAIADVLVDGGSVGAVASYTFTNVTANHTIAASFSPIAPPGGVVGRWRMDEGSGTFVADDSPNGLHGTAIGGPAWVAGINGPYALSFTAGTSQYVQVPNSAPLNFTEAITMAAWIRPTAVATASIINKAKFVSPSVFGYELDLSSTGVPFVRLFNDTQSPGGGRLNATINYPTNGTTWMHVAATYDRTTIKLYINGVLNVTRASTAAMTTNTLPFTIGAPGDGAANRVFPGAIDDARLYNTALTDAEIATLASVAPTYTITASAGTGGSITPNGAVAVNSGASQAFTIAANAGYTLTDVLVDGVSVGAVTNYTFTNVLANHTISASFAITTYTITATAGANGSIAPSGVTVVNSGGGQAYTIAAHAGYHIADVLVNGASVGAVASYSFTNVLSNQTIAASFAQDVAPGNLVGWWPFEEGSGAAIVDASGNGNHGTLPNGASWAAGVDGLAIGMNGTNQRASVPSSASLNITGAITLATWVKPEQMTTQHLIHKGNNGAQDGYELSLATAPSSANGRPFVRFNNQTNGNLYRLDGTQLYPFDGNTWFHLAATYDGTTMKLYVNGVLDSSQAGPPAIGTNSQPLGIGSQSDGQFLLKGMMDDARVYGRALDASEIAALANLPPTLYTITATAGANGSIAPPGVTNVNSGGSQAYTITTDAGYHIADVLVDGASVGAVASHTFTNVVANHTISASFAIDVYTITATAGANGSIAPPGVTNVNSGGSQAYTITADPGYHIADVLVDGASVGAVASHTFTNVVANHTIDASFAIDLPADEITPMPSPGTTITSLNSCVTVPVLFTRTDASPLRAYSVTVELSPNLTLCGAEVSSAGYPMAPRVLQVTPEAGNRWKIDESTLGYPCGVTGSATLFTLSVTSNATSGSGTVSVIAVVARDCGNGPIPASPGPAAIIPIDQEGPAATTDLVATQVKSGNPAPSPGSEAVTGIELSFTLPGDAASVEVYRRGFGHYPQYDEAGGSVPPVPSYPPGPSWTLTGISAPGQTDVPPARDYWYYALVTKDTHGNVSSVSNMTPGTLNYHLGDFSNGLAACDGDNVVGTADVSLLGANYGSLVAVSGPLECVDVGPTTDLSVDGRPTTDNQLEFEDLIMLAINYGLVSAPPGASRSAHTASAGSGPEHLTVGSPALVTSGETFTVPLLLDAQGGLQGLSVELSWNSAVARPIQVQSGSLFEGAGGVVFSSAPAAVDGALLGAQQPGLTANGLFGTVTFEAIASGDPGIGVARIRGRDRSNHEVTVLVSGATTSAPPAPPRTRLAAARPNPFVTSASLEYELAREGPTELAVFAVDGRRVRTLVRSEQAPGVHHMTWDRADDQGHRVRAGIYFARLITLEGQFTQTLVLAK